MPRILFYIANIVLLLTFFSAWGQETKDRKLYKEIQTILNTSDLTKKSQLEALTKIHTILKDVRNKKDTVAMAECWIGLGRIHHALANEDSANYYLEEAKDFFTGKPEHAAYLLEVNILYGPVLERQNRTREALNCLLEADSLSIALNNKNRQARVKSLIGFTYLYVGDQYNAQKYLEEAIEYYVDTKDSISLIEARSSLAIVYQEKENFDSSLIIMRKNMDLAKELKSNVFYLGNSYEGIAGSFMGLYDQQKKTAFTDSALKYYQLAFRVFEETESKTEIAWQYFSIGNVYERKNNNTLAASNYLQAMDIAQTNSMSVLLEKVYSALHQLYQKTGNFKKAYEYLVLENEIKDSLRVLAKSDDAKGLKEKYESEKKEHEINLLKTQNQLAAIQQQKSKIIQYFLLTLLLVAIGLTWFILNRIKIRKALEAASLRNQIAGDLHDDIGSALSSIDINSRIAIISQDNPTLVEKQLQNIRKQTAQTLENMRNIIWVIQSEKDTPEEMAAYMREFASTVCDPLNIELDFDAVTSEGKSIHSDLRRNLFLIYKEAVNNAVKYSQCTRLQVKAMISDNNIELLIKDNGTGFIEKNIKPGNGLSNMRMRADQISASITINSAPGEGTEIFIKYPKIGL